MPGAEMRQTERNSKAKIPRGTGEDVVAEETGRCQE
jgi:hypothetical protein